MLRLAVVVCLVGPVIANVHDVLLPKYAAAPGCKCMPWASVNPSNQTEQARIDSYWSSPHTPTSPLTHAPCRSNGSPPKEAGNSCAMPAASAGRYECDGCTVDTVWNSFTGPWCYCKDADPTRNQSHEAYCTPPTGVPEQINLQALHTHHCCDSCTSADFLRTAC